MKKILFPTLIIFFCTFLVLQSCKKNHDNNISPKDYSLSVAEIKAEYEKAVTAGLSAKPGTFTEKLNPVWDNIKGYKLSSNRLGAYLTLSFNYSSGSWLRMLIMKDSGKVHTLLIESVPDLRVYKKPLGIDYTKLTGKFIFYDSKGEVKGIIAVKEGKRLSRNATPQIAARGVSNPNGDDDADGVVNKDDKCPATPAGQMVDANGCDVEIELGEVEIPGDGSLPPSGWPGGWPGVPPTGYPPVPDPGFPEPGSGGGGGGGSSDPVYVESTTVEFTQSTAELCGAYAATKTGNGYTIGIGNLGFTITIRTTYSSSSGSYSRTTFGTALMGSTCFTVGGTGMNAALASTAIVSAYNTSMIEVSSLAAAGGIPLDNISLTAALKLAIKANMALLPGGAFSSGPCANMIETPAKYGC